MPQLGPTGSCNTDINYDTDVRTMDRLVADADPQNILESPIDGGYLCIVLKSYFYLFTNDSALSGRTLMRQKRLDELREI